MINALSKGLYSLIHERKNSQDTKKCLIIASTLTIFINMAAILQKSEAKRLFRFNFALIVGYGLVLLFKKYHRPKSNYDEEESKSSDRAPSALKTSPTSSTSSFVDRALQSNGQLNNSIVEQQNCATVGIVRKLVYDSD